jgi:SAM-dependent methyltransferase
MNPANPRRILEANDRDYVARSFNQKFAFPHRKDCRVLIVGCGNSRLGEDMIRDGWTGGIVCVDWSSVVIGQMKAKYNDGMLFKLVDATNTGRKANETQATRPKLMEFVCADVVEGLSFQDGAFDLIICKGCFDTLVTGSGSGANARKLNTECHRLLNIDYGALVVVTHGNPESRIVFFENKEDEWWSGVGIHNIAKPKTERRHLLDRDGSK